MLRLIHGRRVQGLLKHPVQIFHAQHALFHGRKDLHVHEGLAGAQSAALSPAQLRHPLQDPLRGQDLLVDEVGGLLAQHGHQPLVDPMGVGDDPALGGLAEDLRQADHVQPAAVHAVPEHVPAAHGGKLVRVPHQKKAGAPGQSVQKGVHQRHVHHAHLVHDDHIEDQRIVLIADEALLRVVFQEPVDGAGVGAGGFGHALGRPARGRRQGEGHAHAGQGVGDDADDGGLARAGAAGDDHDPRVERRHHRLPLACGQGQPQVHLILVHVPEGIGRRGRGELRQLLGDGRLHAGDEGQEDAPLLAHELLHQGALVDHGVHGVGDHLLIHPQQAAGLDHQLVLGQIGVAVLRPGVLQGILDAGEEPGRGVGLKPGHPLGDGVGGHKADAVHVVDELIGVLLDLGQGQIPIHLEHAVGLVHRDPVGGQGQQDLPHGPILVEGSGDHGQLLFSDARDLQQPLRLPLHDPEGVHAEPVHDEPGHGRADALDGAAGEIPFDGGEGGGGHGLGEGGQELLAVLGVMLHRALQPQLFPHGGEGQRAADGDVPLAILPAQRQNGVPVVGIPKYDPVDYA